MTGTQCKLTYQYRPQLFQVSSSTHMKKYQVQSISETKLENLMNTNIVKCSSNTIERNQKWAWHI
jgi:hypothetical protein